MISTLRNAPALSVETAIELGTRLVLPQIPTGVVPVQGCYCLIVDQPGKALNTNVDTGYVDRVQHWF